MDQNSNELTPDDIARIQSLHENFPVIDPESLHMEPMPEVDLDLGILEKYVKDVANAPRAGYDTKAIETLNEKVEATLVQSKDEYHRGEQEHQKESKKIKRIPLATIEANVSHFLKDVSRQYPIDLDHKPDMTNSTDISNLSERSKMSKSKSRRRTKFDVADLLVTVREEADIAVAQTAKTEDSMDNPFSMSYCAADLSGLEDLEDFAI